MGWWSAVADPGAPTQGSGLARSRRPRGVPGRLSTSGTPAAPKNGPRIERPAPHDLRDRSAEGCGRRRRDDRARKGRLGCGRCRLRCPLDVGNAPALLRAVEETHPDAVVVDIRMPPTQTERGALPLSGDDRGSATRTPLLLVLSAHLETAGGRPTCALMSDTPSSCGVPPQGDPGRLRLWPSWSTRCVRLVDGECVVDPSNVPAAFLPPIAPYRPARGRLDRAGAEVLSMMAEGRSNAGIAEGLSLSSKSVEGHVRNIFGKLGPRAGARRPPAGAGGACKYLVRVVGLTRQPAVRRQSGTANPPSRTIWTAPGRHR